MSFSLFGIDAVAAVTAVTAKLEVEVDVEVWREPAGFLIWAVESLFSAFSFSLSLPLVIVLTGGTVRTPLPSPFTPSALGGAMADAPIGGTEEGTGVGGGTEETGTGGWRAACLAAILWLTVRHIDCTSLLCLNQQDGEQRKGKNMQISHCILGLCGDE